MLPRNAATTCLSVSQQAAAGLRWGDALRLPLSQQGNNKAPAFIVCPARRTAVVRAAGGSEASSEPSSFQDSEAEAADVSKSLTMKKKKSGKKAAKNVSSGKASPEETSASASPEYSLAQLVQGSLQAVPGPRVSNSNMPWLVALPAGYLGLSLLLAAVKVVRRKLSPREKRRKKVSSNVFVNQYLDDLLREGQEAVTARSFKELEWKTSSPSSDILRKYLRYCLNEKPFSPAMVSDLIHLRKVSGLTHSEVAEMLNDAATRIVAQRGAIMMDTSGMTERGVKRKAAVQSLFSKLLYLSELEDFLSQDAGLPMCNLKTIFGVTDEDVESIRIETLSDQENVLVFEDEMDDDDDDEGDDERSKEGEKGGGGENASRIGRGRTTPGSVV